MLLTLMIIFAALSLFLWVKTREPSFHIESSHLDKYYYMMKESRYEGFDLYVLLRSRGCWDCLTKEG